MILRFSLKGKVNQLMLEKPNGSDFRVGKKQSVISGMF